jgi:hypothetical protein
MFDADGSREAGMVHGLKAINEPEQLPHVDACYGVQGEGKG